MRHVAACLTFVGAVALAAACSGKDPDGVHGNLPGNTGGLADGGYMAGGITAGGVTGSTGGITGGVPGSIGVSSTTGGGVMGGSVQATGTPFREDDTARSGLDKATLDGLRAGGNKCASDIIYPYEGTMMPAGLISPPFMWAGAADAALIRMSYESTDVLDYQFASGPSNPGEIRIPQEKWTEVVRRTGTTGLVAKISVKSGGSICTMERKLRIARGVMTGAIYYNTYNHPQSGGVGAVLRLTLGQGEPQVYLNTLGAPPFGPCVSCHSVSSNGAALAASIHMYFPVDFKAFAYKTSATPQPMANPSPPDALGGPSGIQDAAFGAITPDGSAILRMGNPDCTAGANAFPRSKNNFPLAVGPTEAGLIDMSNGMTLAASGLDKDHYMWMPQFSPQGTKIVFNDAKPDGNGGTDRRELAIMDYNPQTRAFSNRRTIVSRAKLQQLQVTNPSRDYAPQPVALALLGAFLTPVPGNMCSGNADVAAIPGGSCDGPCYPAWPFFTPDGLGIIFSMISEPDFAVAFPGRDTPSKSELWYADIGTGTLMRLANANKGLAPGDSLANYYPTVLPVTVGGYNWVFWTSMRDFGHRNLNAPAEAVATDLIFGSSSASGAFRKRIWVAAIKPTPTGELGGAITQDPSLPGFYLEGQSSTGNTRAFATLNPCKASGGECTSGLDCCTGFCNIKENAAVGMCVDKVECSKTLEKCETDADCCPPAPGQEKNTCMNHICNFIILE